MYEWWRPRRWGNTEMMLDRATCLQVLVDQANLDKHDVYEAMWAANALDELDERARPAIARIKAAAA